METLRGAVYAPAPPLPVDAASFVKTESEIDPNLTFTVESKLVPAADGVSLSVDVWRANDSLISPVVLIVSPFFDTVEPKVSPAPSSRSFTGGLWGQLIERHFAVALADLRGTRNSGGCVDLGGAREQQDVATLVEDLAKQPWSNGKVAVLGWGYSGYSAMQAAALAPPHLAAIAPIDAFTDIYHVLGEGGAKYPSAANDIAVYDAAIPYRTSSPPDPQGAPPSPNDPIVARAKDQACVAQNAAGAADPTGADNAWSQERDLRPRAAKATAPMFLTQGLLDQNGRADHVDPWFNAYGGPKRAFLWQSEIPYPLDPVTARGSYWVRTLLHFLDHELWGYQNGFDYGIAEVQDSLARWRNETSWPPVNATVRAWTLAKGHLAQNASTTGVLLAADDSESFRADPREDGGALGTKTGLYAQGSTATHLAYGTDALAADLHFAGRPLVKLSIASDRPDAQVVARLYRVLPDGSWVLIDRGAQRLLLRDSLQSPSPAQPLTTYALTVAMQPQDMVLRAGDRIGLVLSSDDASFVLPSAWDETTTLRYGGAQPSALMLPEIHEYHSNLTTWGVSQPNWIGPHAWEAR